MVAGPHSLDAETAAYIIQQPPLCPDWPALHTQCRTGLTASPTDLIMILKGAAWFWKDYVSRLVVKELQHADIL